MLNTGYLSFLNIWEGADPRSETILVSETLTMQGTGASAAMVSSSRMFRSQQGKG